MSEKPQDAFEPGSVGLSSAIQPEDRHIPGAAPGIDLSRCREVDFGRLRVKVPPEARIRMSNEDEVYSDAVFFDFPVGKIRLSVLAAARSGRLWPERADEIATSQARLGAQVSSVWGEWGRELHIAADGEFNWVIGVDGSRSMLLGRATWPAGTNPGLVETMRAMVRSSAVVRGTDPFPVRAPLALRRPGAVENEGTEHESPYTVPVQLIPTPPATTAAAGPPAPAEQDRSRRRPEWRQAGLVAAAATILFAGVAGVFLGVQAAAPDKPSAAMSPPTTMNGRLTDDASPALPAGAPDVVPGGPAPVGPGAVPVGPNTAPVGPGAVPVGPNTAPVGPGAVPVGPAPVGPGAISVGPAPVGPGAIPVGPNAAPVPPVTVPTRPPANARVPAAPVTVPTRPPATTRPATGRMGNGVTGPTAPSGPAAGRATDIGRHSGVGTEDTPQPSLSSRSAHRRDEDASDGAERDEDSRHDNTTTPSGPLGALTDDLLRTLPGIG